MADTNWYPVTVRHKKTKEILTVKSIRVNPELHEVLSENTNAVQIFDVYGRSTTVYPDAQVPVEGEEVKDEVKEVVVETVEDLTPEKEYEAIQAKMKELGNYFALKKQFPEEAARYSELKKELGK